MTRTIAIIPARGGSKGIPRKNLVELGGKPLVAHSIISALACPLVERTIVSTDDEEIAQVARDHGAEVPFLRPVELARDDTVDFPVFEHALKWLMENEDCHPELVVHLRPTSPFRRAGLIGQALAKLEQHPDAHCLRTINEAPVTPYKLWTLDGPHMRPFAQLEGRESYNMPRQDLPSVYWHNGVVDVIRARTIFELGSISGTQILHLEMDEKDIIDIDSPADLARARFMLASAKEDQE